MAADRRLRSPLLAREGVAAVVALGTGWLAVGMLGQHAALFGVHRLILPGGGGPSRVVNARLHA